MKLSPCLELFFKELAFVDRIDAVAEAGFAAAEFWSGPMLGGPGTLPTPRLGCLVPAQPSLLPIKFRSDP